MTLSEKIPRSYRTLAIFALVFVSYWPTLRVGFLWDDHVMIETNPALREWSWQALKHDFTTDVFDGHGDPYYRPAQTLLDRLDYTVWGMRPFGFHLTNLLGHGLNSVLLAELAIAMGLGNLTALLAGCLLAVHPMPVEQLMIIAGRAEIFGFTLTLASLLLFLRDEPEAWVLACITYSVGLLFKESVLITPFLFVCLCAYLRRPLKAYARILPCFILNIPYLLLRHAAVGALMPHADVRYITTFFVEAFPKILLIYARLILVPWNLHSHRLVPHLSHAWPLLLGFFIVLPFFLVRKKAYLALFGLAWFVLMLLPKTPIMIYGNFMLDHWAYPAGAGLLLILAAGYARLWEGRANPLSHWLGMTFFPLLIFWALLVQLNVALRGTDEKMYRWALNFTTSNPIKYNLGVLLLQTGRAEEALSYLEDYHNAYPEDPQGTRALAEAFQALHHPKAAHYLFRHPKS